MFKHRVFHPSALGKIGPAFAVVALLAGAATSSCLAADDPDSTATKTEEQQSGKKEEKKKGSPLTARYDKGLLVESRDGNFSSLMNWRGQFRFTDVSSAELVGEEDGVQEESGFLIRRARFKMKGHAYRPWLQYKFEYGLVGNVLLTFRMDVAKVKQANLWVGQYKVLYNRERVDSSGKLEFVDRSIVNSPFTVDRQQGLTVTGRLFEGKRADSIYAVGVFTGTGRGGGLEGDRAEMWVARWQWNFLKRVLPFEEGAVKRYPKGRGGIAVAAATNTGRFTRFSSSGGGELAGFEETDDPNRYKIDQWMGEFAYQRHGLSAQSEYHFKRIDDRVALEISELEGWYAQVGYFFSDIWDSFPKQLQFAARVARVDSLKGAYAIPEDREFTVGSNWFFDGHANKLTFDFSRLKQTMLGGMEDTGWRARLQWDISF